jgi:hypothetical protein
VVAEILRCGDHSMTGRLGGGQRSYLQVVCDVLQYLELEDTPADGVLALELRVVRYVLDSEFERLAPDVQARCSRTSTRASSSSEGSAATTSCTRL